MSAAPLLKAAGLTKRFPGVTALADVSIEVGEREVVGLIGANGSGKSTLLKILSGLYQPDEGSLLLHGNLVRLASAAEARAAGIGMVFQEQSLLPNLSVAENIMLGVERGAFGRGIVRWAALEAAAKRQLDKIGATISPSGATDALSLGERQMVELAKALATEDNVKTMPLILLDEATSMLTAAEVEVLFEQIRRLRQHASVIFVSHRLDEILEVCDRVYVLRDGACVAQRHRGSWQHEEFLTLMVGELKADDYYRIAEQQAVDGQPVRLKVDGLARQGSYRGIDFALRAGEVLGICGIEGSGREALLRSVFCAMHPDEGAIVVDGEALPRGTPADAVARGIGLVPAERAKEASLADLDIGENISIANLPGISGRGLINRREERRDAERWIDKLRIRTPSAATPLRNLSGGNQQKVVFARWMQASNVRLLLLDHPTRGLDVRAKAEIYGLIRSLSRADTSILLLSDSLEEAIALSHNLLVMRDGEITARIPAPGTAKPSPVDIVEHMV